MSVVDKCIEERRAVFPGAFKDEEVKRAHLEQILHAAHCAPSHRKTEPWRFKVVQGAKKAELADFLAAKYKEVTPEEQFTTFKYNKIINKINATPCVLLICMQRDPMESVPEWEEIAATAMAVQNLWLSCQDKGLSGYWSSPATIQKMGEFTPLNEGERCLGLFYLGYVDVQPKGYEKSSFQDKVDWL